MPGRGQKIAVAAALGLAGLGALAVLLRVPLLKAALRESLAAEGWPAASFDIAELTLDRVAIENISLGGDAPSARSVVLRLHLWDPEPMTAEVEGLRVPHRLAGGESGNICEAIDRALSPPALGLLPWPRLVLRDARLELRDDEDSVEISAEGAIDAAAAEYSLSGAVSAPHTSAAYRLDAAAGARLRLAFSGESDLADLPWPAGSPRPQSGRASFELDTSLPALSPDSPVCAAMLAGPLTARLDLRAESILIPARAQGLSADASLQIEAAQGEARIALLQPVKFAAASLSDPAFAGLPPPLAERISHGGSATLSAADAATPVLRIAKEEGGWTAQANASLKLDLTGSGASLRFAGAGHFHDDGTLASLDKSAVEAEARGIPFGAAEIRSLGFKGAAQGSDGTFELAGPLDLKLANIAALPKSEIAFAGPVKISGAPAGYALETAKPAAIVLTGAPVFGDVALAGPVKLAVASLRASNDGGALNLDAALDPGTVSGSLARGDGAAVPFEAKPGPVTLHAALGETMNGELHIKNGSVVLPAQHVALASVKADVSYPLAAEAQFSGLLRSGADPAQFKPLAVDFKVTQAKNVFEGAGHVGLREKKIAAPVTARFDPASRRGEAHFGPLDLAFAAGGLQPGDLSPAMAELKKAEGSLKLEAALAYDGAPKASGKVAFDSLSFQSSRVQVEGLNGTVEFLDLLAPRTAPLQSLTAKRITAGAPVEDAAVRFEISPADGTPVLAVDQAIGHVAGGTLSVNGATLRAGAANTLTLEVNALSMSRLFENLGTDNLKGTGTLSGSIPVTFGGGDFTIVDGRLKAQEAGVLQVHLGSARETLEKQGQAMSLMVRALEDFHYTALEIGLARPAGADVTLAVKLEGNNPTVLDGYPFRFNINLSGDLNQLLAALQAGQGLTAEVLERAMEVDR
jgi:hypothetical protein